MNQDSAAPEASMTIGEVAQQCLVSAKMIRHYESIGLIGLAQRSDAGYRQYNQQDVQTLCFIKRSRDLGFSLEKIRALLNLWNDRSRKSADVKQLARQYIQELERDIKKLELIRDQITLLTDCCPGDSSPDCSILDGLAVKPTKPT
jgi:MerR family copper efflux transcriptional regulator